MPQLAKDLAAYSYMSLLVIAPARVGKTYLISTVPESDWDKVYVICSDDESKLDSAARVNSKFAYDLCDSTELMKLSAQTEKCLLEAYNGVTAGRYKWVFWDTCTNYATFLCNGYLEKAGEKETRGAYHDYNLKMFSVMSRFTHLKAHVVALAHYYEQVSVMAGQLAKKNADTAGNLILPGIEGSVRNKIPGLFRDVVYMAKRTGPPTGKPEDEKRVFHCSIQGVNGPGSNSVPGVETISADLGLFLAKAQAVGGIAKTPAQPKTQAAPPKPTLVKK